MNSANKRHKENANSTAHGLRPDVRQRFPWTLIPVWFEIYLSLFFPALNFSHRSRSCGWWCGFFFLRAKDLNLIKISGGRLTVTLWEMTADPWTARSAGASVSAICVIWANIISQSGLKSPLHQMEKTKTHLASNTACLKKKKQPSNKPLNKIWRSGKHNNQRLFEQNITSSLINQD